MKEPRTQALDTLQSLHRRHGQLTPDLVVATARPVRSSLHRFFTWDDGEAARKHRLNEARALIRSFEVVVVTRYFRVTAPMFVPDVRVASHQQGYTSLGRLRRDEDLSRETVIHELIRAAGYLARARSIAAGLNLANEIDEAERTVLRLAERARRPDGDYGVAGSA